MLRGSRVGNRMTLNGDLDIFDLLRYTQLKGFGPNMCVNPTKHGSGKYGENNCLLNKF